MRIFVAGATGVLGKRVLRGLSTQGHELFGLARQPSNAKALADLGATARTGDLFDPASLVEATKGCEAVLHLATAIPPGSRTSVSDWALNDRIRREGTRNLVDAAMANGAR